MSDHRNMLIDAMIMTTYEGMKALVDIQGAKSIMEWRSFSASQVLRRQLLREIVEI